MTFDLGIWQIWKNCGVLEVRKIAGCRRLKKTAGCWRLKKLWGAGGWKNCGVGEKIGGCRVGETIAGCADNAHPFLLRQATQRGKKGLSHIHLAKTHFFKFFLENEHCEMWEFLFFFFCSVFGPFFFFLIFNFFFGCFVANFSHFLPDN